MKIRPFRKELFVPTTLIITRFRPYSSAEEFVAWVNSCRELEVVGVIDGHRFPGHYEYAEVTDQGTVWVRFIPHKLGPYIVSLGVSDED